MGQRECDQDDCRIRCWSHGTFEANGAAGAIISGGKGTAEEKFEAFEAAGIACAKNPSELGAVLLDSLIKAGFAAGGDFITRY